MPEYRVVIHKCVDIIVTASDISEIQGAVEREIRTDFRDWTFEDEDWEFSTERVDERPNHAIKRGKIVHIDDL